MKYLLVSFDTSRTGHRAQGLSSGNIVVFIAGCFGIGAISRIHSLEKWSAAEREKEQSFVGLVLRLGEWELRDYMYFL